jgi:hypothetical protein
MEHTQGSERFNAKLRIVHPEFVQLIAEAEAALNEAIGDSQLEAMLVQQHEEYMEESIGEDCYLKQAAFTGFVYETDENERPTSNVQFVSTDQSVFHAMRMVKVNGVYKAMLEITTDDYFDENDVHISRQVYFAAPSDVEGLEIIIEETILETIQRHVDIAQRVTSDSSFYRLTLEDQRRILAEVASRLDFDLPVLQYFGLALDVSRFIAISDDAQKDIRDCIVDQSTPAYEERVQPKGEYMDCTFPELAYQTEAFLSIRDFDLGGGMPCIMLRNNAQGVTYLVPIDAVINQDDTYLTDIEE